MSIPKEPRQLMINLMYLVLTALLALNVSAEIFNAFKIVNHGLEESNASLETTNGDLPAQIKKFAQKDETLAVYGERADQARIVSKELTDYVDTLWSTVVNNAGGFVYDKKGALKGKKNKDATTRLLVNQGKGEELKTKIEEAQKKFLDLINPEERDNFAATLPLKLDDETWKKSEKKNWAEFNFKQMPVGAVEPIFTKFKNDTKNAESAVLNYLLKKTGTAEDVVLSNFKVVSSPKKTYIIAGETFETDIFLSSSASETSKAGISISVGGQNLPLVDGVAKFTAPSGQPGIKDYLATIRVTNPVTGEVKSYEGNFSYEVGRRSVAVAADKMNVFYIGVDNPVTISAAGVSTNDLKVNATGGGIQMKSSGGGKYNVTVSDQGTAKITVSGGGLTSTSFEFRVKRIPDPVAKLAGKTGGQIGSGELKAQLGILAVLDGFDFDARCNIDGFTLTYAAPRQDLVEEANSGPSFGARAKALVGRARPGDTYYFDNVRARCPGDKAGRVINSLVFKVR